MKQEFNEMVGTEWQCVDPDLLNPEKSFGSGIKARAVYKWCLEFKGKGDFFVSDIFGLYYFECEEDRMMFILRWS